MSGRLLLSNELAAFFVIARAFSKNKLPSSVFFCPFAGLKPGQIILIDESQADAIIDLYLVLLDLKLDDNIEDENGLYRFGSRIGKSMMRKSIADSRMRISKSGISIESLESSLQSNYEEKINDLDDATSKSSMLFSIVGKYLAQIIGREDLTESMQKLGESVGRAVNLLDMIDDLPRDLRFHRYNSLIEFYGKNSLKADDIFKSAYDDVRFLANEYLCDIAISLMELPSNDDDNLLRAVFGYSLEHAFAKHFVPAREKVRTVGEVYT